MSPVALTTSRTTLLSWSAMNRSPAESTARPPGAVQLGGGRGPVVARVTGDAVAGGGHDRARGARGEVRGAAVGGRDGDRARRQARGRERRHAVDQRLAADRSALVAEGDRPPVRSGPARRQVADGRGERDRLSGGRRSGRGDQRREGGQGTQQGALFEEADLGPEPDARWGVSPAVAFAGRAARESCPPPRRQTRAAGRQSEQAPSGRRMVRPSENRGSTSDRSLDHGPA